MRVLHITGSPRGERSRSRAIAEHLLGNLGDAEVEVLDLWTTDLPEFDGAMLESRYRLINGLDVDPAFADRWQSLRDMVDHLLSFDLWLFSTPMWNFGLPYRLKHYVDCVIQPTMAFTNDATGAVTCHGTDKTAVIIGSGALDTRPGAPLAAMDFAFAHLTQCLQVYFGVAAVYAIRVMPTFGDERAVEDEMIRARAEAAALALSLKPVADARG